MKLNNRFNSNLQNSQVSSNLVLNQNKIIIRSFKVKYLTKCNKLKIK
jgi:hypothetical protein